MITPPYVYLMARYNAWQTDQLLDVLQDVPEAMLTQDEGAFFGSVLGTLNHLLWGDTVWMSRFDPRIGAPSIGLPESARLHATVASWAGARRQMDAAILRWAEGLQPDALAGTLSWYSGVARADVTRAMATCVIHMFNHQTHHRGQVHAMLTRAGLGAPVSDLFLLPEDA